jgi:hypothetical protein
MFSGLSVSDPSFVARYEQALEESDFPLWQIVVELIETAEITNREAAAAFGSRFASRGVSIVLDDYSGGKLPVLMDSMHGHGFKSWYAKDAIRLRNIAETSAFLRGRSESRRSPNTSNPERNSTTSCIWASTTTRRGRRRGGQRMKSAT